MWLITQFFLTELLNDFDKFIFKYYYTYSWYNNWTPSLRKGCKASSRNGYFQLTTDVYSGSQMGMNS